MITGKEFYDVVVAVVPLYVAMILGYGSVRWWNIFTPEQCAGINRFVAVFAVPLLSFHFISLNDIYFMNFKFMAADSLQKVVILLGLFLWQAFAKNGSLEWMITLFSLSTLPNTLVIGIPLLKAMYGDFSGSLLVQIVVFQGVVWYTLMLVMFEYRGAKLLIAEQFSDTAASIKSFRVDSNVVSLNGRDPLETDAEIGEDGKVHVVVRRSSSLSVKKSLGGLNSISMTPRASNLSGVEIYSIQSLREPTPRISSFNQTDFYAMFASGRHGSIRGGGGDAFSRQSSKGLTPTASNLEDGMLKVGRKRGGRSMSGKLFHGYPPPNPMFTDSISEVSKKKASGGGGGGGAMPNKELHMFVWSSNSSPVSEANLGNAVLQQEIVPPGEMFDFRDSISLKMNRDGEAEMEDGQTNGAPYSGHKKSDVPPEKKQQMPPTSVMTRLILIMVWRKLIRNPNTYGSLTGLIWALISFRWNIKMPAIVSGSIAILSDAGLGMAMFSLGLFTALQPQMIACGKSVAAYSMAVRFLTGPAVMAATSVAIGIRGVLLHVAIVQAALPQGIVPFVFAKEYNVHADVLSTGVIFGMVLALPVTIIYYVLLGL